MKRSPLAAQWLALPLLLLCCCGPANPGHLALREGPASTAELPLGWREVSVSVFERQALEFGPLNLSDRALAQLGEALSSEDLIGVRAAVLLARSRDPRAKERILVRLEQRVLATTREGDAGEVVCATALSDWELSGSELDRLERLVVSAAPHPDVEVRTEIACAIARNGRSAAIPFLLRVLREGTLAQDEAVEWERKPQMAWAKSRAAETLSELAGIDCVYQEDGAFAEQAAEAARLEDLLLDH